MLVDEALEYDCWVIVNVTPPQVTVSTAPGVGILFELVAWPEESAEVVVRIDELSRYDECVMVDVTLSEVTVSTDPAVDVFFELVALSEEESVEFEVRVDELSRYDDCVMVNVPIPGKVTVSTEPGVGTMLPEVSMMLGPPFDVEADTIEVDKVGSWKGQTSSGSSSKGSSDSSIRGLVPGRG